MEAQYKEIKADLPKHKSRFAPGGRMVSQFKSLVDLEAAREAMKAAGIETELETDGHIDPSLEMLSGVFLYLKKSILP